MNLQDLIAAIDDQRATPRFIRYLIAAGVVPAPTGGRKTADYGDAHLAGVKRYLALRDSGIEAQHVKAMSAAKEPADVPYDLAPGVTLILRKAALDPAMDPRRTGRDVQKLLGKALGRPAPGTRPASRRILNGAPAGAHRPPADAATPKARARAKTSQE